MKLDKENKVALEQLQKLGHEVWMAHKVIERQKEIKDKVLQQFRDILQLYPKARAAYYSLEKLDD